MITRVASIQYSFSDDHTKQERIEYMSNLIDQVNDVHLILLPEAWAVGFLCFDRYKEDSEPLDGETISMVSEKAKQKNAYILAGTIIEKDGEDLYNTAVFINPQGYVVSTYRKIHLVTRKGSEEIKVLKRGTSYTIAETEFGKIGFGICYDLRFPELYRKMAVKEGAEIFLQPAAWPLQRTENWVDLMHARANENQAYLISCNCAGLNRGVQYFGHSAVVDPHGISIASAGLQETIIKSEINVEEVRKFRKDTPHFGSIYLSV